MANLGITRVITRAGIQLKTFNFRFGNIFIMKKISLVILILLLIVVPCVYIFIPGQIRISTISPARCIPKNITESLHDPVNISRWWREQPLRNTDSFFSYKGYGYKLTELFTDGAAIQISTGGKMISTRMMIIQAGKDSSTVEWQASITPGLNPFKRVQHYFEAGKLKKNMQEVLASLLHFATISENIYGFHIERTTFTDTILFATRFSSNTIPSVESIYGHIDELKKKIKDAGAVEKDYPMLHVNQLDSTNYETMIAICVNKEIEASGNFFVSRMVPMKDRFLKTVVTGGESTIQKAHHAIHDYMEDHFLSAPAIPFEILMTDRSKEKDTTKWNTIIFYPSM